MPGLNLQSSLCSRVRLSCVEYSQHLPKISVVICMSSAVNEKKFKYLLTEEPTSRILKSRIQETEDGLEFDDYLSCEPACSVPFKVREIYMHIFHQQKTFPSGQDGSVRVDALRHSRQRHPGGGSLHAWCQVHASCHIPPSDRRFGVSSCSVGPLF